MLLMLLVGWGLVVGWSPSAIYLCLKPFCPKLVKEPPRLTPPVNTAMLRGGVSDGTTTPEPDDQDGHKANVCGCNCKEGLGPRFDQLCEFAAFCHQQIQHEDGTQERALNLCSCQGCGHQLDNGRLQCLAFVILPVTSCVMCSDHDTQTRLADTQVTPSTLPTPGLPPGSSTDGFTVHQPAPTRRWASADGFGCLVCDSEPGLDSAAASGDNFQCPPCYTPGDASTMQMDANVPSFVPSDATYATTLAEPPFLPPLPICLVCGKSVLPIDGFYCGPNLGCCIAHRGTCAGYCRMCGKLRCRAISCRHSCQIPGPPPPDFFPGGDLPPPGEDDEDDVRKMAFRDFPESLGFFGSSRNIETPPPPPLSLPPSPPPFPGDDDCRCQCLESLGPCFAIPPPWDTDHEWEKRLVHEARLHGANICACHHCGPGASGCMRQCLEQIFFPNIYCQYCTAYCLRGNEAIDVPAGPSGPSTSRDMTPQDASEPVIPDEYSGGTNSFTMLPDDNNECPCECGRDLASFDDKIITDAIRRGARRCDCVRCGVTKTEGCQCYICPPRTTCFKCEPIALECHGASTFTTLMQRP